jgi:histidine decarboxylase
VIAPGPHLDRAAAPVSYIGGRDATISGSRTGHTTLMLAHALTQWTITDLRARAERARELAAYTTHRLVAAGVPAWRHPHAFTVAFPAPSPDVLQRWRLPVDGDLTHIICMPGRTHDQIDRFVRDLNPRRTRPTRQRRRRHAVLATTPTATP